MTVETSSIALSDPVVANEPAANGSRQSGERATVAAHDAVLGTYKRPPIDLVRGQGVYLHDSEGNRYLDFVSGIAVNALGYGDEGLRSALHAAADGLIHTSNLYWTDPGPTLAA